jgi:hypothetical protein
MRIWDIPASKSCVKHLLGEHRELHAIWNILTQSNSGYSRHPETLRWKGKLAALYLRHEELVNEMIGRNYRHKSELNKKYVTGCSSQNQSANTYDEQIKILKNKGCKCKL